MHHNVIIYCSSTQFEWIEHELWENPNQDCLPGLCCSKTRGLQKRIWFSETLPPLSTGTAKNLPKVKYGQCVKLNIRNFYKEHFCVFVERCSCFDVSHIGRGAGWGGTSLTAPFQIASLGQSRFFVQPCMRTESQRGQWAESLTVHNPDFTL